MDNEEELFEDVINVPILEGVDWFDLKIPLL